MAEKLLWIKGLRKITWKNETDITSLLDTEFKKGGNRNAQEWLSTEMQIEPIFVLKPYVHWDRNNIFPAENAVQGLLGYSLSKSCMLIKGEW